MLSQGGAMLRTDDHGGANHDDSATASPDHRTASTAAARLAACSRRSDGLLQELRRSPSSRRSPGSSW